MQLASTDQPLRPRLPWLTIWSCPRQTIRRVIAYDPRYQVMLLAVLAGINRALDRAVNRSAGDLFSIWTILGLAVVGGVISGPLLVYLLGFLFTRIGRWLNGQGSSTEVRAAIAWATVPSTWTLPLVILQAILFGREWFMSTPPSQVLDPELALIGLTLSIILIVASLWSLFAQVVCLSEVHRYSVWRAVLTIVLSGSLILVVVFACVFLSIPLL